MKGLVRIGKLISVAFDRSGILALAKASPPRRGDLSLAKGGGSITPDRGKRPPRKVDSYYFSGPKPIVTIKINMGKKIKVFVAEASAQPYVSGGLLAIEKVETFKGLKRGLDSVMEF